jgi:hypothetical protein
MTGRFSFLFLSQTMFMLAILTTPIAYDIGSIRANDIFVMLAVTFLLMYKRKISNDIVIAVSCLFLVLVCSIIIGAIVTDVMNVAGCQIQSFWKK